MVVTVLAQFVFIHLVSGLLLIRSMCTKYKPMLVPNGKLSKKKYSSRQLRTAVTIGLCSPCLGLHRRRLGLFSQTVNYITPYERCMMLFIALKLSFICLKTDCIS